MPSAVVLHKIAGRFVELHAVQFRWVMAGNSRSESARKASQVFGAGHLAGHEGHVEVEVFVVDLLGDVVRSRSERALRSTTKPFRVGLPFTVTMRS
jgi:hypothetical protein